MTYGIVESLLTMTSAWKTEAAEAVSSPWQHPDLPVVGSMKVIRVTGVKKAGIDFHGILVKFLEHTARPEAQGPQWQGITVPDSPPGLPKSAGRRREWQLFSVIKDFGQAETNKILNVPNSVLNKSVSSKHPAYQQARQLTSSTLSNPSWTSFFCQSPMVLQLIDMRFCF